MTGAGADDREWDSHERMLMACKQAHKVPHPEWQLPAGAWPTVWQRLAAMGSDKMVVEDVYNERALGQDEEEPVPPLREGDLIPFVDTVFFNQPMYERLHALARAKSRKKARLLEKAVGDKKSLGDPSAKKKKKGKGPVSAFLLAPRRGGSKKSAWWRFDPKIVGDMYEQQRMKKSYPAKSLVFIPEFVDVVKRVVPGEWPLLEKHNYFLPESDVLTDARIQEGKVQAWFDPKGAGGFDVAQWTTVRSIEAVFVEDGYRGYDVTFTSGHRRRVCREQIRPVELLLRNT